MRKMRYQQLTEFLLTQLPTRYHRNFYSFMQNGKLINEGRQVTETGVEVAQIEYQAVLYFDQLPFKEINPYNLLGLIQIWLNEHDDWDYRSFETPFNIDILDDSTAELDITLTFREPITAVQDEAGNVLINEVKHRFDEIEVYTATEIDVAEVVATR